MFWRHFIPGIWLNAGTLRPARAVLPEGSIVNSAPGAAIGMRSLTCAMTQIVTTGAFAQALPDKIPVAAPGGNAILNVKTTREDGQTVMASIGPVGGGGGALPFADGGDGAGGATGFLRNTPVEITESEVPIHIRRYGLETDTGAPGRWRGGLSAIMEFEVSQPGTIVTARNRNRSTMAAWGLRGAGPAKVSKFLKNPDTPSEENLGNSDIVQCVPGDVIRVIGPGAGGWGDPQTRPVDLVLQDIRRGAVSSAAAINDYGVVITDGELDLAKTSRMRNRRNPADDFYSLSSERQTFETVWTRERYSLLTEYLAAKPVSWRFFLKRRIFDEVGKSGGVNDLAGQMTAIFSMLDQEHLL
jgi:N-methylhydantoinase B